MTINERIKQLYLQSVESDDVNWNMIADVVNKEFNTNLSSNAVRMRNKNNKFTPHKETLIPSEMKQTKYNDDGTITADLIVHLPDEIKSDYKSVLAYLGYMPENWKMESMSITTWQMHTKTQDTKNLYSVKFKITPITKEFDVDAALDIAKKVFGENIKAMSIEKKPKNKTLNKDVMLEIPAIELHLGKLAWSGDTGEDYDQHIAKARFRKIIDEAIQTQLETQADTCFICIGNDFFNTDTVTNTTTKGTPQNNDIRWKKMFLVGLQLYTEALITLREYFNKIDVRLVQGNHDIMSSFYLYVALQQHFIEDNIINFSDDYKTTQCYLWGQCAIFTNHGDGKFDRLIRSIPVEFPKEWALSIFRELHCGHLHKEVLIDDNYGLLARRIGSPSGTDEWHYTERYIGAGKKHQMFIWDANQGLQGIRYVNFNTKELSKTK